MDKTKRKLFQTIEEVEAKLHENFGFSVDRQKEFAKLYAFCTEENSHTSNATSFDPQVRKIFEQLQAWHQERIDTLTEVAENEEAELLVQDTDGKQVSVDGDMAKGMRAGLSIAVELFTPFPVTMTPTTQNEEEE